MGEAKSFGRDEDGRELFLHSWSEWRLLGAEIPPIPSPFLCVLASDATEQSAAIVGAAMLALMRQGCHYIVCWGPDCERVHDIWDEEYVCLYLDDLDNAPGGDSTWHSRESLDEALWFAMFTALCCRELELYRSILVLCEERHDWGARAAAALSDPLAFSARVLAAEEDE